MKLLLIIFYAFISGLLFNHVKNSDEIYAKLTNNINNVYYEDADYKDKPINVLVKLNYDSIIIDSDIIRDDSELKEYRKDVKNYYFYNNELIIEKLKLTTYEYVSSFYSPHIEIIFANYREFENDNYNLIEVLNYSSFVDKISINYLDMINNQVNGNSSISDIYPFKQALADVGLSNRYKTGYGIKVGIMEMEVSKLNDFYANDHYEVLSNTDGKDKHCDTVASIIGGDHGIAKDIYLYCVKFGNKLVQGINQLVNDKKVNVINMSMEIKQIGTIPNPGDYYNDYCEYLDYVVNTAKVSIVKSAGNNGTYITIPGCGLNVITVGASNCNREVSSFSSWQVDSEVNYLYKPDFVAPGENITIAESASGTSFAAPFVTGIIALLMEEFPYLKTNPSLVKSALQVGCNKVNGQTDYYDEHAGFGLVNYSNTRQYLIEHNEKSLEFIIQSNHHNNDLLWNENVKIQPFGHIEINANWMIPSNYNRNPQGEKYDPIYSRCKISLVDLITGKDVELSSLDSNMGFICYYNMCEIEKEYRIEVRLDGEKKGTYDEIGSIVYHLFEHPHEYSYKWIDGLKHKCMCMCGDNDVDPHVISANDINYLKKEYRCVLCKGIADMGLTILSFNENLYRTINGSYILPNGVIVLVDEDFESYLNGTLEFYNYNEM